MDSIEKQLENWGMSPDEAAWALALVDGPPDNKDPKEEAFEEWLEEYGLMFDDCPDGYYCRAAFEEWWEENG